MLVLPSPPDASERMPGIVRKISAVVRGADCWISCGLRVVMETDDSSLETGLATPVTKTSSRPSASVGSTKSSVCVPPASATVRRWAV